MSGSSSLRTCCICKLGPSSHGLRYPTSTTGCAVMTGKMPIPRNLNGIAFTAQPEAQRLRLGGKRFLAGPSGRKISTNFFVDIYEIFRIQGNLRN